MLLINNSQQKWTRLILIADCTVSLFAGGDFAFLVRICISCARISLNVCLQKIQGEQFYGEYLPGNLQERLRELRERNGFSSCNKLANELGIDRTTYSRIENGTAKTISSDILVKLSKLYNVPTDYILGLSNVPQNTAYDIAELGLSVEAAKNLYSKKIDSRVINELLLNENFAVATRMMATYFSHAVTKLIQSQNVLLDNSMNVLDELIKTGAIHGDRSAADLKKRANSSKTPQGKL